MIGCTCNVDTESIIYFIFILKFKRMATIRNQKRKDSASDEEEEILVKNLQTGQNENSKELIRHHRSLILNKNHSGKIWMGYLSSINKMKDKLLELVIHKKLNELKNILIEYPVQLSQFRYMDGWTLLHFAVGQNEYNIVETLLQFGIDVDLTTTGMLRTALHQASFGNKPNIVQLLIDWGAEPNLADADRNTAIHFAVDYGYEDIVKIILKSSIPVDLNARNCMNMTTFNTCRNPEIFEILIEYEQKMKKNAISSRDTDATIRKNQGQSYQSRLIIRNSDVFPCTSRADMVQKFLSLREAPAMEKKVSNDVESVISEESFGESLESNEEDLSYTNKKKKRIGAYLKNKSIMRSQRIASQNIGLVKQSIFMTYLEGQESVENFDIIRKLGEGSFAEVFMVRRKQSSNYYALKKIGKKILIENNLRKYIEAEKDLLTKVKHPFIIQVYSCLQDFTHLYILMQFCEFGDLQKFVRKQKLSQNIARTYVCEAALALEEIHNNGFLYRDLKVSNVLLDRQGHLRLADFGLAKQATTTDSFLGSVSYMAPQMLADSDRKPHNKALDWYLLGIFVYELLHGLPPFYSENRQEMEERIKTENPTFNADISQQIKEVILSLLEKNPEKRLQSLQQLKKVEWLANVDWTSILNRKGAVLEMPKLDLKELRRKEYYDYDEDKQIDQKIEWFQGWNYPTDNLNS